MMRWSFFLRVPVILLLAHLYVAIRLSAALPFGMWRWLSVLALFLIYLLIIIGFASRRSTGKPTGDILAWIGFLFLGLFSWLFVLTLIRDVLLLAVFSLSLIGNQAHAYTFITHINELTASSVLAISLSAVLWGLFNARRQAKVVDLPLYIDDLPEVFEGYTLVQITDLHIGPTIKHGYVNKVVNAVNALSADAIVLTGDMVDGDVSQLRPHTQPLSRLKARDGVYAVTGNHEYYCGANLWITEFRRLGIQMLMNEHITLSRAEDEIIIAGVTDFGAQSFDSSHTSDPALAIHGASPKAAVKILLAHQPRSAVAAAAAGFDIQLSGHTHGGQFWPWNYFVPLQQPHVAGLHHIGNLQIYISRGTGYWGPPMRIGARSEITRIRLHQSQQ